MKTRIFVNPDSGHFSNRNLSSVLEQLHTAGIIPEVFLVRTPSEITAHCKTIVSGDRENLIIVAGGDGTFNAVVNGLEPGGATLAVLPFGTSNVLASEIGITSIEDGVRRIIAGRVRPLSVGVLEFEGRTLRFVLMAGIGLDGAVVRDVWPLGKKLLRQGAYVLSALKHAVSWDDGTFELHASRTVASCHTVVICNASRYGGDYILSPGNSPFSPGLAAICITGTNRRTYLGTALKLFRGKSETDGSLTRIRSSVFEIRGDNPIQIDGDFVGHGPARISEYNDFARIIV